MRRDRGISAGAQKNAHELDERGIHVGLLLVRDFARLAVGALDESHPHAKRVQPVDVARRALETGLNHRADIAVPDVPHGLEHLEREIGVRRTLHVDSNEEAALGRRVEDAAEVVDAGRAIHVQAELREFQRDVASDAGMFDRGDRVEVAARGHGGLVRRGHALAEEVEGHHQALLFDLARGVDGFRRRFRRR